MLFRSQRVRVPSGRSIAGFGHSGIVYLMWRDDDKKAWYLERTKIIGNTAKIHPIVVVFSLIVGEQHGGLTGALIAVPVVSVVQALFLHFFRRWTLVSALAPEPLGARDAQEPSATAD